MRTPFQEEREVDRAPLRLQIAEGFRFLWSQPFLRTCAFLYGLGNFTGTAAFLIWPSVYVLTAAMLVQGLTLPVTDSVVDGYRVAVTPDRLLGRVENVRSNIALLISSLGPLAAGVLLSSVSARATVAFFLAFGLLLALWGTLSPSIRNAPSLDELDDLPATG